MSHMLLVSHTDDTMSRRWFPRSLWGGNKSSREFCVRFLICFVVPKWRRREKEVIRIMEIKEDFMALFEKARTFSKCEIQRRVNGTDEVNYPKKNKQEKRRKKISYIYHIEGWRRKKTSFISNAFAGRSQENCHNNQMVSGFHSFRFIKAGACGTADNPACNYQQHSKLLFSPFLNNFFKSLAIQNTERREREMGGNLGGKRGGGER